MQGMIRIINVNLALIYLLFRYQLSGFDEPLGIVPNGPSVSRQCDEMLFGAGQASSHRDYE